MIAVDSRITTEIFDNLKKITNNLLLIGQNPLFDLPVSGHADMNILQVKNKIFSFASTNVLNFDVVQIKSEKAGKLSYPDDVRLNAVCIDNDFICRKASVDKNALQFAEQCGMRIVGVNQGYVKCNIAVVSEKEKAIITEDEGIRRILTSVGYDVLKLEIHGVCLDPYEYGFIGGASGKYEDKLLFTGDVTKHCEYYKIKNFCDKYSVEIISLSQDILYDYGSLLVIDTDKA